MILQLGVVLDFFFLNGVLIGCFQHIVCGVSHAPHIVLIRDADGKHQGCVCMPQGGGGFLDDGIANGDSTHLGKTMSMPLCKVSISIAPVACAIAYPSASIKKVVGRE